MTSLLDKTKQLYRTIRFRCRMSQGLPSAIGFELTSRCNSLCPMCVRRDCPDIVHEDMDFALLKQTVEEVKNWPLQDRFFNLTGLSEPTLYPRLTESVAYTKRHLPHSRVKLITNGIALTTELSRELLKAGLDEITISVNGTSREDYLALCGVDAFEIVTENIKALIDNRRHEITSPLCINLNFKRHGANTHYMESTISYWKHFLDDKDVISISNILPLRGDRPSNSCIDAAKRYPCAHLWGEVKIDIQGNIYPCDGKVMDYHYRENSELFLGNIRNITVKEAYLSDKVRHFRTCHLEGKYFMLPSCQSCPIWSIFPNHWIQNIYLPFLKTKWL